MKNCSRTPERPADCACGQRRAIEWAERMVEEVLPVVPYRQIVFTIPRMLRKHFLYDRTLYGELCRTAYASTRDFLRQQAPAGFPRPERAVPAMVVVPQSFADLLVSHPHIHALVSLGVFLREGNFHSMEDVDFSGLEGIFRERVFDFNKARSSTPGSASITSSSPPVSRYALASGPGPRRRPLRGIDHQLLPSGLALRARLRARPSPPTAARCPAAPGSSPLASSRLSRSTSWRSSPSMCFYATR